MPGPEPCRRLSDERSSANRERAARRSRAETGGELARPGPARRDDDARPFQRRMRRLRHLRSSRGREPRLPRALRAAAPRPGERRHRLARRRRAATSTGRWATSPTSSRRTCSRTCRAASRSATCATRRPARATCRTRSRSCIDCAHADRDRRTTATWSTPGDPRRARAAGLDLPGHERHRGLRASPARARGGTLEERLVECARAGARRLLAGVADRRRLIAVRDPHGFRPLSLGRLGAGLGRRPRDVRDRSDRRDLRARRRAGRDRDHPPRPAALDAAVAARAARALHLRARLLRAARLATCSARASTRCAPSSAASSRASSRSWPTSSCRCPTRARSPRSASPRVAASRTRMGLIRNHYVGRTFIEPQQSIRIFGVRVKLNPVREHRRRQARRAGRRLDRARHDALEDRRHGARRRRARSARPRSRRRRRSRPCFYGVDTPKRAELIARDAQLEEIRAA